MAMAPVSTGVELWDPTDPLDANLTLDCFLPTGVYVPLKVNQAATLHEIKEHLWNESQKFPLYATLKDRHSYHFMCINQMAEKEELVHEEKRVCDVKPFMQMLKVVEKEGEKGEKVFNSQISTLIGKALKEFDRIMAPEVGDFRRNLKLECKNTGKLREQQNWTKKALYMHPPDVAPSPELPKYLKDKVKDQVFLKISIPKDGGIDVTNAVTMTMDVPFSSLPKEVIRSIVVRKPQFELPNDAESHYILKICGRDEYLLGEYSLSQYNRIRKMMSRSKMIHLILVSMDVLYTDIKPQLLPRNDMDSHSPRASIVPPIPVSRHTNYGSKTTWDINEPYEIMVCQVSNTNMENNLKVCMRAGIYHGGQILCQHKNTKEAFVENGLATFNEPMMFDLQVADIPRMARLCFLLYSVVDRKGKGGKNTLGKKAKDGRQEIRTLAWVNYPVFDYKDNLRGGIHTLFMWTITDDNVLTEELLNALGTVEGNPNSTEAIALNIDLGKHTEGIQPIKYPSKEQVLLTAEQGKGTESLDLRGKNLDPLRQLIERDPLDTLHEQEKQIIWMLKMECLEYFPDISLPKLLLCISWNKHDEVAQMLLLLEKWPPKLKASKALELLDFNHPEREVRSFAVQCLEQVEDNELARYLLQLVQVLKYECYLDCDLVHFLLRRALNNQRIGHYFFWLLRSEMHVPSVSVRFGLILEAYCHGSPQHVTILSKQVQALNKLKSLNILIKKMMTPGLNRTKEQVKDEMKIVLRNPGYSEALSNFSSTLDPRFKLAKIRVEECRFMDSKMRPLWMVWDHTDSALASDQPSVYTIYKDGDDLRQDMLTLQIIGIMDQIWQSMGLDLRMTPYTVLSTGCNEGLIETVLNSKTIASIQQDYANMKVTAAFNEKCLYQYLQDKHQSEESLKSAIEEFTLSCAGYCVATYVLGIGDRHADNIMIKDNGQMFHIDFGHVLGNFKSKFGYKRERVPFVLSSEFITVINHGSKKGGEKDQYFKRFQRLCEDAYLALHKESNLLITLFLMMTNTGIPELSNVRDIEYLRKTLCPSKDLDSARKHFQEKFKESKDKGFSTSLNNFFHHLNHMNS